MNSKTVAWIFVLFISLMVFLFGVVNLAGNALFYTRGEKVKGTVSAISGTYPSLVFSDRYGGSHITPFRNMFANTLTDRQPVTVVYNPRNPDDLTVDSFVFLWMVGVGTLLVGLAGMIFSAASIDWSFITVLLGGKPPQASAGGQQSAPSQGASDVLQTRQFRTDGTSITFSSDIFGPIKPLIDDKEISDIIIASPNAVFVKKGSQVTKSPVVFQSQTKYEQVVERMLSVSDNSFTIAKPIVDGMVTPSVRIHAVHRVLCEEGPYVTLRISRFSSVKFQDVCNGTMAPRELLYYLRAALLSGHSILIAGEVGTGKTTLIRALGSTIPKHENILVIEDTPEIKIEHPAVRYVRTRESNTEGVGKVSPGECIRAGMRMSMDRIIFGEIRDPEAAESFIDVCQSGHTGMSTIHARSAHDAISRLELFLARQQPGVERPALRDQIGSAVQIITYARMCKVTGMRRITDVIELKCGVDGKLEEQEIFKYGVSGKVPVWKVLNKQSYFEADFRSFEGGFTLGNLPDWLRFPDK